MHLFGRGIGLPIVTVEDHLVINIFYYPITPQFKKLLQKFDYVPLSLSTLLCSSSYSMCTLNK